MAALSKILRSVEGGGLMFLCPGCGDHHTVNIGEGAHARWAYNGNPEKPTFTPSILVRSGHFAGHYKPGDSCWCSYNAEQIAKGEKPAAFECVVCHSYITDGRIQFLNDCTHKLAGQTVDLPEWTELDT